VVFKLIDLRLPLPGTNGYTASDMIKALWAAVLTRKGRAVLAMIDELRTNEGMRAILGLRRMPSSAAVADWLRQLAGVELRHAHGTPCRGGVADGLVRIKNLFASPVLPFGFLGGLMSEAITHKGTEVTVTIPQC